MREGNGVVLRLLTLISLAAMMLAVPAAPAASAATRSGVTWAIQDSPNITVPSGQVQAISCPAATACTAVGYYLDSQGLTVPLAESWDGSAWQQQPVPVPAGAQAPGLNGVSCPSATFCEAVGITNEPMNLSDSAFAEMWNGSSWAVQSVPAPAGGTSVLLKAVSCVSASFCEAVGSYLNSSRAIVALVEKWNGTAWALQTAPALAGTGPAQLDGVSCVSARFCEAVDAYGPVAERWNGTSWTARTVPYPAGMNGVNLDSVSCTARSYCEAVGDYNNPNVSTGLVLLAEEWDGTAWHEQSVPRPASLDRNLVSVSCVSTAFCEAVGYKEVYASGIDTFRAMAEAWRGSGWALQRIPSSATATFTQLAGVSCASVSACEAGGEFPVQLDGWNGTSWAKQAAVVPRAAVSNALNGVSCATATFCAAVGTAGIPLNEVSDGTSWTIVVPSPLTSAVRLGAVSCVSATFCEAVGSSAGQAAAVWNGTSWQPQPTPASNYVAVSCASATFCAAIGASWSATWNGTVWSVQPIPIPSSVTNGRYFSVSCASADSCEAVGGGLATSGGAFAAGWDGTSWTQQAVPGPSGATLTWMGDVSCAAPGSCVAVGLAKTGSAVPQAYSAGWDGTAWTEQGVLPVPGGATRVVPTSVSCSSSTACTAVGYSTGPTAVLTLAESWDGTSWTIEPTLDPAATGDMLTSVSCLPDGHCVAVGHSPDPGGYSATLVEAAG